MSEPDNNSNYQPHRIVDDVVPLSALEEEQNEVVSQLKTAKKQDKLDMDIKVYSPFKEYYVGPAFSVSAENTTGPFDILPGHHNFITLLSACEMVLRVAKGEQKIQISGGIMHVKANRIVVFLDI